MVGAGSLMVLLALLGVFFVWKDNLGGTKWYQKWYLRIMLLAIALPYLANSTGWLLAEMGRQPWIVRGLQKTAEGVSTAVPASYMLITLVGFTLLYGVLAVVDVYLLSKYARKSPEGYLIGETVAEDKEESLWI